MNFLVPKINTKSRNLQQYGGTYIHLQCFTSQLSSEKNKRAVAFNCLIRGKQVHCKTGGRVQREREEEGEGGRKGGERGTKGSRGEGRDEGREGEREELCEGGMGPHSPESFSPSCLVV